MPTCGGRGLCGPLFPAPCDQHHEMQKSSAREDAPFRSALRWAANLLRALGNAPELCRPPFTQFLSPACLLTVPNFVDGFLWRDQEISCGRTNR